MERALRGAGESDVPCGGCTACCESSQFVHIEPDERATLDVIPAELLFPAPRMPEGHVLLGYDEHGRCPMLSDGACTIYDHRPRTCRTYDCRIFPAAAVEIDDPTQSAIAERARRWKFTFPTETDRVQHDAMRAATAYLVEHPDALPGAEVPVNATQRAVLAIRVHEAFVDEDDRRVVADPGPDAVTDVFRANIKPAGGP